MDILSDQEVRAVVERLMDATSAKELEWRTVDDSPYDFMTSIGSSAFFISSVDRDDAAPFRLDVWVVPEDHQDAVNVASVSTSPGAWNELSTLYGLVKRTVLRLDEAARKVLRDLGIV